MTDIKKQLDAELSHITLNIPEEEIIIKAKKKPAHKPYVPRLVAAMIALILIATVCFVPGLINNNEESKYSFVVYAGAQEIPQNKFVVINDDETNFVHFDFNKILDENADPADITKKYLFHSLRKDFKLKIEGENIEHFEYHINKGILTEYEQLYYTNPSNYGEPAGIDSDFSYSIDGKPENIILADYRTQNNVTYSINPVCPTNPFTLMCMNKPELTSYIALPTTGNIVTDKNFKLYYPDKLHVDAESLGYNPIAYGFRTDDKSAATDEEIAKLREYAKADDMVGFYNYQNQIFKRLFDEVYIDILVYKTKNTEPYYYYEFVRLEFCYNPIEVTDKDIASANHSETLSKGTLSARLVDMPQERQDYLLSLRSQNK